MFGLSFFELVVIMAVALIALGPKRLPEAARAMGKLMGELRRNSDQIRREFYNAVYKPSLDLQRDLKEQAQNLVGIDSNCETKAAKAQEQKKDDKPQA